MKNILAIFIFTAFCNCIRNENKVLNAENDSLISHIEKSEPLIEKFISESNIPGASIAITYKGQLIWKESYGYENLEYKIEASDSTKYRVASVSKLFTGTAIYKLHRDGALNIDLPISEYLDSIPDHWKNITSRQIAHHTSGIGHYIDVPDALDVHHYKSTKEALEKFKDRPLLHNPDEGVTYSSYAYTLLAAVIEKVTQKPYLRAMEDIVFKPFGMGNTLADNQRKIISHRSGFYQYNIDRKPEHTEYIDLSGRWAGSGFLSTASDLARFGMAHTFYSNFFTKKDLDILTAPRILSDSTKSKEGLGWGQRKGWEGRLMYWGDGKTPGSTCGLLVYPELDLTIAITTNIRHAPLERGEFQIFATRLINSIEGKQIEELQQENEGLYDLDITIGENVLKASLEINSSIKGSGSLDIIGVQKFEVADAFIVDNYLWILSIGGGKNPIPLGILPMRLKIDNANEEITGELFRIEASVKGIKR